MTTPQPKLFTALSKFQGKLPLIPLDKTVKVRTKTGGEYTFAYAPLPTILEKIRPILVENELSFIQTISENGVTTAIYHSSGESIESTLPVKLPVNLSPQDIGSWVTYMKRYSLCLALGIAGDDDDDANVATGNSFQQVQKATSAPQSKPSTKVKPTDIKLEQGDKLATGTRKTGKDIGKPWYALDKADGNRIWLTQDQYEYLGCFAPPPTKAPLPSETPPTPDEIINDLPF